MLLGLYIIGCLSLLHIDLGGLGVLAGGCFARAGLTFEVRVAWSFVGRVWLFLIGLGCMLFDVDFGSCVNCF